MKKETVNNQFKITIPAKSCNEAFSRSLISSFISHLDPTIEELCDIKTAVSEAVTNCIVHAYRNESNKDKKKIYITAYLYDSGLVKIKIKDTGCGIEDIEKALEPMYSGSASEERSGMGFSIMQVFTDKLSVKSKLGKGTTVTLSKYIGKEHAQN